MNFIRTPSVVFNVIQGQCLALDASNGTFHVLNETAGWLLRICEQQVSLEDAVQRAAEEFEIPAEVNLDEEIRQCLNALGEKGLLSLS